MTEPNAGSATPETSTPPDPTPAAADGRVGAPALAEALLIPPDQAALVLGMLAAVLPAEDAALGAGGGGGADLRDGPRSAPYGVRLGAHRRPDHAPRDRRGGRRRAGHAGHAGGG